MGNPLFLSTVEFERKFDELMEDESRDVNFKDFTRIFDTGYGWGLPYRLDREKYAKLFAPEPYRNIEDELVDISSLGFSPIVFRQVDSVYLNMNVTIGEEDYNAILYVSSNVKDNEIGRNICDYFHVCDSCDLSELKKLVTKVTDCFVGNDQVDNKFIDSMIAEKEDQINGLLEDIEMFRKFKK